MSVKDKNRASKVKSARQEGLDLFMECEDEDLSASQIAAHQQAESEYEEAIQKINALKSGNVQIIQSNQNSTIPVPVAGPAPVAGQQIPGQVAGAVAQRSLQPSLIGSPRVGAPLSQPQSQQQQYIIQNPMPMAATSAANAGYKLLLDARTGLIIGTVPNDGQSSVVASPNAASNAQQSPLSSARLHIVYGQPRRTSNKASAVKLFESGKDVRDIANMMRISESAAEVYLIDSLFLGEDLDYTRLSQLLNISGDMMTQILDVLSSNPTITLAELQQETIYAFNQIRLCIARMFRGFFWKAEEDDFRRGMYAP